MTERRIYKPGDDDWYERPNVYQIDDLLGVRAVRASSIGSCPKALALDAVAAEGRVDGSPEEPNAWLVNAWEESAALEQQAFDVWLDEWHSVPLRPRLQEGEHARHVQLDVPDHDFQFHWTVEGTTDYEVVDKIPMTVEIKVVGAKLFEELSTTANMSWDDPKLGHLPGKYRWQVASYVRGLGQPCVLVWCEKENGGLTGKVNWYVFYPDTLSSLLPTLDDFRDRLRQVGVSIDEVRDGAYACTNTPNGCHWEKVCHAVVTVEDPEFSELVARYEVARKAVKECEAIKGELNDELQNWVDRHGPRLQTVNGSKVTVSVTEVPERVVKAHTRKTMRVTYKEDK